MARSQNFGTSRPLFESRRRTREKGTVPVPDPFAFSALAQPVEFFLRTVDFYADAATAVLGERSRFMAKRGPSPDQLCARGYDKFRRMRSFPPFHFFHSFTQRFFAEALNGRLRPETSCFKEKDEIL